MTFHRRFGSVLAASLMGVGAACAVPAPLLAQERGARPELSPMGRVPEARAAQRKEKGETDRVFGGMAADPGEWPFQVALLTSGMLDADPWTQADAQFCGGSLIAPDWVLTAAHCLFDGGAPVEASTVTVLLGATHLTEGSRIEAAEIVVHEGYNAGTLDNDIGLVRLAGRADAPTIALTTADVPAGRVTVTGWGMIDDGTFPADLMEAEVDLQSNDACNSGLKQIYRRDVDNYLRSISGRIRVSEAEISKATETISGLMGNPLTGNMICAGATSGERDACNGDSGGPLFMVDGDKRTQIGIVSWGDGPLNAGAACGHENAFGVYTRIANYKDWIAAYTGR